MEPTEVIADAGITPTPGSVGLETQLPSQPTTVSGIAAATGGVGAGNQIEVDIDDELFKFEGADNAPLMQMMLKAKKRTVKSMEVQHPLIDEERCVLSLSSAVAADTSAEEFDLPLVSEDRKIPRQCMTLLVKGVSGYDMNGVATPGVGLMLYVLGTNTNTNLPRVIAVNGPRTSADALPTVPAIPADAKIVTMSNMLYETQAVVPADSFNPQLRLQYLQKRGMTSVVSDYYEHQKKRIPFGKAAQAEQAIKNFLLRGNRTLWASALGKIVINTEKTGQQYAWSTMGLRWQFLRELQHSGAWTFETLIGLAKMFFTCEDAPKTGILLCGKDLLESLQCIDYTKHPEIVVSAIKNTVGWSVTNIHTTFGDIQLKHDPTLDNIGWSKCGGLIGEDRLVHYVYSEEHKVNDRIEGEEASRSNTVVWDALCLKGTCHVWINGDSNSTDSGATVFQYWDSTTAPTASDVTDGAVYYFLEEVSLGSGKTATYGSLWQAHVSGNTLTWTEYDGSVLLG